MSEGTGGSFLTSGTPAASAPAPAPDMTTAQGAVDAVIDGPPEYIPPKYWDPEKRAPRVEDLGRGYMNLEKLLGREKIPMPVSEDDQEGWERVYRAIGRPEKPDEYEFERPSLPEDLPYDEDLEKHFRTLAHANGWNKKQAKNAYDSYVKVQLERHAAYHEAQKRARGELEQALVREHGQKIEAVKQSAVAVMTEYADGEFRQYLDQTGLGNDPRMVRFLYNIAKKTGGETRLKGAPVAQASPQDAKLAIDKFRAANNKALFDKAHPDHKRVTDEYTRLFQSAYGE
jgi:hypothetical protein